MSTTIIPTQTKQRSRLAVASVVVLMLAAAQARADKGVSLRRDSGDAKTVIGRVELAAAPAAVWERFRQVDRWRELFTDVKKLEVRKHEEDYWRVRLDSAIFTCGPHDYELRFAGTKRAATLKILAPGADSEGQISAAPGSAPGSTVFEYRLRVQVSRVAGWFVSEKDIRDKQDRIVRQYLVDLARAFGSGGPAQAAR
jgi:hypothetical protein